MKPWTTSDIIKLRENAHESIERLSYILQRSKQAIYQKRKEAWNLTPELTKQAEG